MKESNCWKLVEAILAFTTRVLLHGKPGTGKTHAGTTLGLKKGQEVYSLTLTDETPAAELRGHFIMQGNEYVWMDGPAISAWRTGGRLVINEIQRGSPDVQSLLLAICDDPAIARLTLPNGETVKPEAGFSVVATMNGDPKDALDPALCDRFGVTVMIDEVHPDALKKLPENLREAAAKSTLIEDDERRVSIRCWLSFHDLQTRMVKSGLDKPTAEQLAAQAVFGQRAGELLDGLKIAAK